MTEIRSGSQSSALAKDASDERLEERPAPRVRWDLILIWFMRLLGLLWIAKGIVSWAVILGAVDTPTAFETRSTGIQATIIYFAVIDLVAAVGLWLTSTWGGVLWLLAVMSHLILAFFFPRTVTGGVLAVGFFILLIAAYLCISWFAANEDD